MYAVYHGPEGLRRIARRVALLTQNLANALEERGYDVINEYFFDTILVKVGEVNPFRQKAERQRLNFRYYSNNLIGISLDETTTPSDLFDIINSFVNDVDPVAYEIEHEDQLDIIPAPLSRTSTILNHPVFNKYHSETLMMRYIRTLENKDFSLVHGMIPLGSCTMKLNAASEMIPLSWTHWSKMHPFAPVEQVEGYSFIVKELSRYLCEITAFDACSLQPNSGAQGEYAGLLTIKAFHKANGEEHRDVMLIPISAHGTNPASAVMSGMKVVVVKALENGYIDIEDLKVKA
jgi:glycine dehydrogenase